MVEVKATPKFMRLARKVMTQESLQKLIDEFDRNFDKNNTR